MPRRRIELYYMGRGAFTISGETMKLHYLGFVTFVGCLVICSCGKVGNTGTSGTAVAANGRHGDDVDTQPTSTSTIEQQIDRSPSIQLPGRIEQLRVQIQRMNFKQICAAITAQFGPETRDVGSGLYIPQWDVAGGKLTCHQFNGPTFKDRAGHITWLLQTRNPTQATILRDYEMTTLPDPKYRGLMFVIGELHIAPDMTYRFVDDDSSTSLIGDQSTNYFIACPTGRIEIEWVPGVGNNSLLETLGDGTIANLTFHPATGTSSWRCAVFSSSSSRRLELRATKVNFELSTSWLKFWP